MELSQFITDVIVDIRKGVTDANQILGKDVIPRGRVVSDGITYVRERIGNVDAEMVSVLAFELALTDSTKNGTKTGIGVLLGSLNLGTKQNNETENISLSKIKFNIPITLY